MSLTCDYSNLSQFFIIQKICDITSISQLTLLQNKILFPIWLLKHASASRHIYTDFFSFKKRANFYRQTGNPSSENRFLYLCWQRIRPGRIESSNCTPLPESRSPTLAYGLPEFFFRIKWDMVFLLSCSAWASMGKNIPAGISGCGKKRLNNGTFFWQPLYGRIFDYLRVALLKDFTRSEKSLAQVGQ